MAAAIPGRRTAATTSSRRGRTIRSAIGPAKCFMCAISTAASSVDADGAADPPRNRALHRRVTAAATAGSRSWPTASRSSCCSTCRWAIRSRSPGSRSATSRTARAGSRSRPMSNGCSASRAARRRPTVVTERDAATGAIFARNPWNMHHGARVAFADLGGRQTGWTADRSEFIGRNCTADNPAALSGAIPLSQRVGAGLDPCAALQTDDRARAAAPRPRSSSFSARPTMPPQARALIERYRAADLDAVHREVVAFWDETLGAVQVKTPDRVDGHSAQRLAALPDAGLPLLGARRPSIRQAAPTASATSSRTSCRLMVARPELARAHILRAAARQFVEGDVQHWWFPPAGQGVRTRISDDRAWLATRRGALRRDHRRCGDPRRERALPRRPGAAAGRARSLFPARARPTRRASLFEHCARGLDLSLAAGAHGLPLMGTGDWNDGMNRVGEEGRGESVWLGWFLHAALDGLRADRARPAARPRGRRPGRRMPRRLQRRSIARAGTATGIAAAISTTARRSARPPATNAASIPSRNPGR